MSKGNIELANLQTQYTQATQVVGSLQNITTKLNSGRSPQTMLAPNQPGYSARLRKHVGDAALRAATNLPAQSYSACLANPAAHQCRIPDSYARPTALYLSKKIMNIYVSPATNGGVQGRFAFCCSPILGNIDNPLKFQDAICNPASLSNGAQQTIDWTSVTPYLQNSPGMSNVDPRLDNNIQTLTQGDFGFYFATTTSTGASTAIPFGTAAPTVQPSSNNLQVLYSSTTNSLWKIPQGQYLVTVQITGTGLTGLGQVTPVLATDVTAAVLSFNSTTTSSDVTYAVTATRTATNFRFTFPSPITTITGGRITITPTMYDDSAIDEDNGFVEKIRPVAMSVLCTYSGTELNNGGNIAIGLLPGDAKASKFITNQPEEPGNLRTWDNIANANINPYQGRLEFGAYCYWVPESNKDFEFVLPSEMNSQEYPTIVCAGEYTPSSTILADTVIAQLIIYRLFEYETVSTLVDQQIFTGGQDYIDATFRFMATQPRCMENPSHVPWYKKL